MNRYETTRLSPSGGPDTLAKPKETVAEIYQDRDQTPLQRRTLAILDEMPISFQNKRLYFVYDIWRDSSNTAGDSNIGSMFDRVWNDGKRFVEYQEFHRRLKSASAGEERRRAIAIEQGMIPEEKPVKSPFQQSEEKFFRSHPEAIEVFILKSEGLGTNQISAELGKPVKEIDKLTRGLILFQHIHPNLSARAKTYSENERLLKIIDLRDKHFNKKQIAEGLGLSLEQVEYATRFLLWATKSPTERLTNAEAFAAFCKKVQNVENVLLSDAEIAELLHESVSRVKRARKRLRDLGLVQKRSAKDISAPRIRRLALLREEIKSAPNRTNGEIAIQILTTSRNQVKHQRAKLIASGEVDRKVSQRPKIKEKLKRVLNRILEQNREVNLSQIHREEDLGVSWSTIQSLYHEIASEQEVPPLITSPKRVN